MASPLPNLGGGVELLVLQSALAHPDPTGVDAHETEHCLCILLLVEPDEFTRRAMRSQAECFVAARAEIVAVEGADWGEPVARLINHYGAAAVDIVLALPEHSRACQNHAATVLRKLKADGRHQVCSILATAPRPGAWSGLGTEIRFISASKDVRARAAVLLHLCLAQLSAPRLVECVTVVELHEVFSGAGEPALLLCTEIERLPDVVGDLERRYGTVRGRRGVAFLLQDASLATYRLAMVAMTQAGIQQPTVVAPGGLMVTQLGGAPASCILIIAGEQA